MRSHRTTRSPAVRAAPLAPTLRWSPWLTLAAAASLLTLASCKPTMQLLTCGAAAKLADEYLTPRLQEQLQRNAQALKIAPEDLPKYQRGLRIGTASVTCLTAAALAGTVYENVSRRDMEHRRNAINGAVAIAEPVTMEIALPESGIVEQVRTSTPYPSRDGRRTCKAASVETRNRPADPPVSVIEYCQRPDGSWVPVDNASATPWRF